MMVTMDGQRIRCDEVVIQCIVRAYDADGQMTDELVTQPRKFLRSKSPEDFGGLWAFIDGEVERMEPPEMDGQR
jgi:hypothetical protein